MFNPNENQILPTGNNAESITNPKGDNAMDTNNQDFTDNPQFLKDVDSMKVTFHSEKESKPVTPDEILAGNYLAKITDAQQKVHKSEPYFMIIVNMVVAEGEFADFPLTKFYHLKSQKALDFFKKEMELIGYPIPGEDEVSKILNSLRNTHVMTNVLFNESGNKVIYMKSASMPKKPATCAPKLIW